MTPCPLLGETPSRRPYRREAKGTALEAQAGCTVEGDATALRILVRNLVDNAVRYTPSGGRVELTVTEQPGQILLTVDDSGVTGVVICGIATNICCFYAARDLRAAGFRVLIVEDACAGIDVPAAGLFQAKAKAEGQHLGIEYVTLAEVIRASVRSGPA